LWSNMCKEHGKNEQDLKYGPTLLTTQGVAIVTLMK